MKSIEAENEELKKQLFQSKQKSSKYAFDDEPCCLMKITNNHNYTSMHICNAEFFFIDTQFVFNQTVVSTQIEELYYYSTIYGIHK